MLSPRRRIGLFVCLCALGVLVTFSISTENRTLLPLIRPTSHYPAYTGRHAAEGNETFTGSEITGSDANISAITKQATVSSFMTSQLRTSASGKLDRSWQNSSMTSTLSQSKKTLLPIKPRRVMLSKDNRTLSDLDLGNLSHHEWLLYWRPLMLGRGITSGLFSSRFRQEIDLMKAGPFDFLPQFKNPCWYRNELKRGLYCLPYFYLIGAPKSGTTDIYLRLLAHPEYASTTGKEPHWLTRVRFYRGFWGRPVPSLEFYIRRIFSRPAMKIIQSTYRKPNTFNRIITGDCSASTIFDNDFWPILPENQGLEEPLHTNADFIHHINPNTKIIAILRNPIERLYSDFLYFEKNVVYKTKQIFHIQVEEAIRMLRLCSEVRSVRSCVNDITLEPGAPRLRLRIGLYVIYLEEFFRVFPRDQILVLRLEDHSEDPSFSMGRIFDFLGMSPLPESKMTIIGDATKRANMRPLLDRETGSMLPETRELLYQFYKPFNERLANVLGDELFNYGYE